jgi:hypothetical protein
MLCLSSIVALLIWFDLDGEDRKMIMEVPLRWEDGDVFFSTTRIY